MALNKCVDLRSQHFLLIVEIQYIKKSILIESQSHSNLKTIDPPMQFFIKQLIVSIILDSIYAFKVCRVVYTQCQISPKNMDNMVSIFIWRSTNSYYLTTSYSKNS